MKGEKKKSQSQGGMSGLPGSRPGWIGDPGALGLLATVSASGRPVQAIHETGQSATACCRQLPGV